MELLDGGDRVEVAVLGSMGAYGNGIRQTRSPAGGFLNVDEVVNVQMEQFSGLGLPSASIVRGRGHCRNGGRGRSRRGRSRPGGDAAARARSATAGGRGSREKRYKGGLQMNSSSPSQGANSTQTGLQHTVRPRSCPGPTPSVRAHPAHHAARRFLYTHSFHRVPSPSTLGSSRPTAGALDTEMGPNHLVVRGNVR